MTECSSNEMTSLKIRRMQGGASGKKPLLPLSQILGALNVSDRALVNPNIAQPLIAWEAILSSSIIRIAILNYDKNVTLYSSSEQLTKSHII